MTQFWEHKLGVVFINKWPCSLGIARKGRLGLKITPPKPKSLLLENSPQPQSDHP